MAQANTQRYVRDNRPNGHERHDEEEQARGNQTLPVALLPVDFDGIPLDGAQYLAVVRRQAHAAPAVIRAARHTFVQDTSDAQTTFSTTVHRSQDENNDDEADVIPSQAWRERFLLRFRNMRESLSNRPPADGGAQIGMPKGRNARKWFRFLHGCGPVEQTEATESLDVDGSSTSCVTLRVPTVALLHHFRTTQLLALLEACYEWIQEGWQYTSAAQQPTPTRPAIDDFHAQWLFAALAHLEDQLVGADVSTLRDLARACTAHIAQIRIDGNGRTDPSSESGAWIVVCAIAGVWGQHDLWIDAASSLRSLPSNSEYQGRAIISADAAGVL